jgi:hypothetical protein
MFKVREVRARFMRLALGVLAMAIAPPGRDSALSGAASDIAVTQPSVFSPSLFLGRSSLDGFIELFFKLICSGR